MRAKIASCRDEGYWLMSENCPLSQAHDRGSGASFTQMNCSSVRCGRAIINIDNRVTSTLPLLLGLAPPPVLCDRSVLNLFDLVLPLGSLRLLVAKSIKPTALKSCIKTRRKLWQPTVKLSQWLTKRSTLIS